VREKGQIIGYMSVRTKPRRDDIAAADKLYADIRKGKAKGIVIEQGAVVKTGIKGWISKLNQLQLNTKIKAAMLTQLSLQVAAAIIGVLAILVTLSIWLALHTALVRPIKQALEATYAITGGDLSSSITSDRPDEIGRLLRALRQMNINLTAIISDVRANVESINGATREITAGNMDLSRRTESQASNLEETAASMEELAGTVRQNAESALQANQLAASASAIAVKGGDVVAKTGTTMSEITIASQQQSSGITQVHAAVNDMDQSTQQNAALVEQAAAAANSLEDQTTRLLLAISVSKFQHR